MLSSWACGQQWGITDPFIGETNSRRAWLRSPPPMWSAQNSSVPGHPELQSTAPGPGGGCENGRQVLLKGLTQLKRKGSSALPTYWEARRLPAVLRKGPGKRALPLESDPPALGPHWLGTRMATKESHPECCGRGWEPGRRQKPWGPLVLCQRFREWQDARGRPVPPARGSTGTFRPESSRRLRTDSPAGEGGALLTLSCSRETSFRANLRLLAGDSRGSSAASQQDKRACGAGPGTSGEPAGSGGSPAFCATWWPARSPGQPCSQKYS